MSAFKLLIRLSNGTRMEVGLEEGDNTKISVLHVKECIAKQDPETPVNRQRLIYKGKILEDARCLSDYGIVNDSTLFMVKSQGTTTPAANPPAAPSSIPSTNSTGTSGVRPAENTNPMMAMMQQMQNAGGANPFGMPGMGGQNNNNAGGMPMPNPEQMQAMLNSPQMQGLMDNPDLLGTILQQSMQTPQMQQLMEQNPELRQVWNDPAMIQQAIQMMRNPQHMQTMMRQQDLAMSQLENMPGGFAALSSMYRNVQEPMMEATQASQQRDEATPSRNSGSIEGATGAPMPNPWGAPPPAPANSNNATSSNPWGGAAAAASNNINPWGGGSAGGMPNPWAAAGGAGAGGMPGMMGGNMPQPNMDQMMQMLDNPAMSQMMNDMVQNNPDMIRTMLEAQNPMMRQMFQGNPDMANNFIRQMFNPENMRNMMQMQRAMMGNSGGAAAGGMPNFDMASGGMPNLFGMPNPAGAGAAGAGSLDFSQLLQGLNGASVPSPAAPPANPADRYRNQLLQLYGMGFDNEQANLAALQAAHGNLNRAVDQLLSDPPPPAAPPAAPAPSDSNHNNDAPSSQPPDGPPKNESEKKND